MADPGDAGAEGDQQLVVVGQEIAFGQSVWSVQTAGVAD
jgi:hypothetical protein